MERFIQTQIKAIEALGEFVCQLNSKFESMSTRKKNNGNSICSNCSISELPVLPSRAPFGPTEDESQG